MLCYFEAYLQKEAYTITEILLSKTEFFHKSQVTFRI